MANELKVTRIEVNRTLGSTGNPCHVVCYYTNVTTVPPTPGSVALNTTDAIVETPIVLQGAIDTELAGITDATIDWSK